MRLIDADPLCRQLREEMNEREKHLFGNDYNHDYMCGEQDECDRIYDAIDEAPTIDAVPLVRCKDCVCAEKFPYEDNVFKCTHPQWCNSNYGVYGEDYCSYGERRDEA